MKGMVPSWFLPTLHTCPLNKNICLPMIYFDNSLDFFKGESHTMTLVVALQFKNKNKKCELYCGLGNDK